PTRGNGTQSRWKSWPLSVNRSVDQTVNLLPEPAQNARLGDADRVGRNAKFRRDLIRTLALQDQQLKGPPSGRLELRLDQLQQPADDVAVVFLVPEPAEPALGVFQLVEHFFKLAVAGGDRPRTAGSPKSAQAVHGDRAQPAAERPAPQIVP